MFSSPSNWSRTPLRAAEIVATAVSREVAAVESLVFSAAEQVTEEEEIWTLTVLIIESDGDLLIRVITATNNL